MRVIIAGSRSFDDEQFMATKLTALFGLGAPGISEVVSGACPEGADSLGESWAAEHCIRVKQFPADWERYAKAAGFIRNGDMANYGQTLVAFWDGESSGTRDMISQALKAGLDVHVFQFQKAL